MTPRSEREAAHNNWSLCVFLSIVIMSMASCTAWVEGKRAETVCERISR